MKRGKISYNSGTFLFRVSKPGFDVDTATVENLLLHESFLFSQVISRGYVTNDVNGKQVTILVPDSMANNVNIVAVCDFTNKKLSPDGYAYGGGTTVYTNIFTTEVLNDSQIKFSMFTAGRPTGIYYMLLRKKNG